MTDEEVAELVEGVRSLDRRGASDNEVAAWLMARTRDFGSSGKVLQQARGLTTADAYAVLHSTEAWRSRRTRLHLRTTEGTALGKFSSANGRTYEVGHTLNLPNRPEPPHRSEPGRGTVWQVRAVAPDDDPSFVATLVVAPLQRLEVRERAAKRT